MQNIDFGTLYAQITDTIDDDARAKIHSAVVRHMSRNDMMPNFEFLPATNSIIAGTKASELVNNSERPDRLIIGVNYAPPDRKEGTRNNHRKDFFCANLGEDAYLNGTVNGLEFSYVKSRIQRFFRLTNTNSLDSQFRSLQVLIKHGIWAALPKECDRLIKDKILEPVENLDAIVPNVPDITHVLQVDNFQNVKLVPSRTDRILLRELANTRDPIAFDFGRSAIELGGALSTERRRFYEAVASETLFEAPLGTNVVAEKSSSILCGQLHVPIIATIRDLPAETDPKYADNLPKVGFPVFLTR